MNKLTIYGFSNSSLFAHYEANNSRWHQNFRYKSEKEPTVWYKRKQYRYECIMQKSKSGGHLFKYVESNEVWWYTWKIAKTLWIKN